MILHSTLRAFVLYFCILNSVHLWFGGNFAFALSSSSVGYWNHNRNSESQNLENWILNQTAHSTAVMLRNISPSDCARGVVVASPSKRNPDYYYHWTRDAALVMLEVLNLYEKASTPEEKSRYAGMMTEYVEFSERNQQTDNPSGGSGEPKFNVDGSAFTGAWGRPQNDGPALRAITLIRFAKDLLANGKENYVRSKLYDGKWPSRSVIKADLEFVSSHWRESSFDLWEEVKGQHFNTRIEQRKALLDGADLADQLNDPGAASWYRSAAKQLETEIYKHWDSSRGYLVETLNRDGGANYKNSGLDSGVILGVLHSDREDGFFAPSSDKVLATAMKIQESFQNLYDINKKTLNLAPAIGRYPEDMYDGYSGNNPGNPWVITTLAFSELYYRAAQDFLKKGVIELSEANLPFFRYLEQRRVGVSRLASNQILIHGEGDFDSVIQGLKEEGDRYLERVMFHTPQDGSMSEQINRYTGKIHGAHDLTWSYSSFLRSVRERQKLAMLEGEFSF